MLCKQQLMSLLKQGMKHQNTVKALEEKIDYLTVYGDDQEVSVCTDVPKHQALWMRNWPDCIVVYAEINFRNNFNIGNLTHVHILPLSCDAC